MNNKKSPILLLGMIFTPVAVCLILSGVIFWIMDSFVAIILLPIGLLFGLAAIVLIAVNKAGQNKKNALLTAGNYVMAEIVDIDIKVNQKIHYDTISMHPYFITCRYVDEAGNIYYFKSGNLLYNPSGLLKSNLLKVYVDLEKPGRYQVDTDSILPGNAVLHKFKYDSKGNAERLMQGGQYLTAVTCGVEHMGRIRISSVAAPMFLHMSENLAAKLDMGVDDKNRAYLGYTILCRYDAPDGTPHIFASTQIFGEAESDYIGQEVKVYYSGADYKRYHVDISGIQTGTET